jgi:protein SCO1/2
MRTWIRLPFVLALLSVLAPGPSSAFAANPAVAGVPLFTPWIPVAQRSRLQNLDIAFKDQDGRSGVLSHLIDKPVAITFFYSRCQNSTKCSLAVAQLGALQRQLAQAGLSDKVRLLAITYEPQFDTPERISRFATDRGLWLGENALALQLDSDRHQQLVDEIQAPANYNAGWVNAHGVELSLLDASGRLVRKYHTLLWDNDQVVKDLKRVLAEH